MSKRTNGKQRFRQRDICRLDCLLNMNTRNADLKEGLRAEAERLGFEAVGVAPVDAELRREYYERWIAVFANILFEKRILTPGQLAVKMDEVERRYMEAKAC